MPRPPEAAPALLYKDDEGDIVLDGEEFDPVSADSFGLLSTTVVDTDVATKQALYTVPTGKQCIVTLVVLRGVSASLAAIADGLAFDFAANPAATGWVVDTATLAGLSGATRCVSFPAGLDFANTVINTTLLGTAAAVFGCLFLDTAINATLTIDVFGYLVDA